MTLSGLELFRMLTVDKNPPPTVVPGSFFIFGLAYFQVMSYSYSINYEKGPKYSYSVCGQFLYTSLYNRYAENVMKNDEEWSFIGLPQFEIRLDKNCLISRFLVSSRNLVTRKISVLEVKFGDPISPVGDFLRPDMFYTWLQIFSLLPRLRLFAINKY